MSTSAVHGVMSTARSCAFAMLANATYVQEESAKLQLDDALRSHIERVCGGLIGTKHDILTELDELAELLGAAAAAKEIAARVERIIRWLAEDVGHLHELVTTIGSVGQGDPALKAVNVLVLESAANILASFNRAKRAADLYRNSADGS